MKMKIIIAVVHSASRMHSHSPARVSVRPASPMRIAAKDAMLAMKLRANRPGRDTNDIRQLMRLCGITSLDQAEELYEDFYPGDALTERAHGMVKAILDAGLPAEVPSPGPIEL